MARSRKKMRLVLVGGLLIAAVLFYLLVIDMVAFYTPTYAEGPGTAHTVTERQVVQAEIGFDLPASATTPRMAVYGGKDYSLAGTMWADADEVESVLVANGYESKEPRSFQDMTSLYPKLSWFVLPENEIQSAFEHPDHRGQVLISTRRDEEGLAEVFFEQKWGHRDILTWQYFE